MIKAIYHVPLAGLKLCKDTGFTHANLCLWSGKAEEFYRQAHELGLHCIISERSGIEEGKGESLKEFLALLEPCDGCLIEMPDEPNRNGPGPRVVSAASEILNFKGWKTIVTLADTHSCAGWENVSNCIAFDNYELDFWHFFKLWIKIRLFRIKNKSLIFAAPAVKPGKIVGQFNLWQKWIRPDGYYWYPWTVSQEKWADRDLDGLPEALSDFRGISAATEKKSDNDSKWESACCLVFILGVVLGMSIMTAMIAGSLE